jgi:hypothetical protein
MAHRLGNTQIDNLPGSMDAVRGQYGIKDTNGKFIGIAYYNVEDDIEQVLLKELIPEQFRTQFRASFMVINSKYIPPHKDNDITMVVNYYTQTSNATTTFWKQVNTNTQSFGNSGSVYDECDLTQTSSFKAEQNDVWVLNVSEIHSVRSEGDLRTAYCLQSETVTFDEFLKKTQATE